MSMALLLVSERQAVGVAGTRIERSAFRVMGDAAELTRAAASEARQIVGEAHIQAASIAEDARVAGWDAGRREGLIAVLGTLEVERRMRRVLADRLAQLVVHAVRSLVGELDEHELFHRRVLQLLARADEAAPPMRLHVSPAQAPLAQSIVSELVADRGSSISGAWIAVAADELCAQDTIVLETADGFIDADVELTLVELRAIVERAIDHADHRWPDARPAGATDHGA